MKCSRVCVAALFLACGGKTPSTPPPPTTPAPTAPTPAPATPPKTQTTLADVGLDASAMDRAADPCDDFYQYACGGWLARTEIPADRSVYGRFVEIFERNEAALHDILEKTPATEKIGAFYAACMDEAAVDADGTKPIQPLLATVAKVKDARSLRAAVVELHRNTIYALFNPAAEQDYKDATQMILRLTQDGMGLPEKGYYLRDDDRTKAIRVAYQDNVEKMMVLAGRKPAAAAQAAKDVLAVETAMAKVALSRVDQQEPEKTYHPTDAAGLAKLAPSIDWKAYLAALGRPDIRRFNVTSPEYLGGMSKLFGTIKPAQWRSYLAWQVVLWTIPSLPKAFVEQDFQFRQTLTGAKELPPRWKRCVRATDQMLGELLAQPWLKLAFGGDSKTTADRVVGGIVAAMDKNFAGVDWMDDTTRARAQEKLKKMIYLVGYPAKWKTYDFEVGPSLAANMLAGAKWRQQDNLAKVGKPVDRLDFGMTPPTVNAYYDASYNKMVYPAGILQTPFFNAKAAWAVNFGGIGMVAGHELTHGFDSAGALFDGDGNMSGWWEKPVVEKFKERTAFVEKAYSELEGLPGEKVNGKLTLGENIADMGGVKLALSALHAQPEPAVVADGFSQDQQFFLGFGQAWCSKYREEEARMRLQTDEHSPPRVRVNGTLRQTPAFSEAFQCKVGSRMRPENTCVVW